MEVAGAVVEVDLAEEVSVAAVVADSVVLVGEAVAAAGPAAGGKCNKLSQKCQLRFVCT